jgi:hypothetical protein
LSDDAVIRLISTRFVPVVRNLWTVLADKEEAGNFVRSVMTQSPGQIQGLWLVTGDGKFLAGTGQEGFDAAGWTKHVLEKFRAGMKKFGPIAPRPLEPKKSLFPYRGIGVRPDGSVRLAVTDKRIMVRDVMKELPRASAGETKTDSVTISAAEWAALAPAVTQKGSRWEISPAVGRRFFPLLNHNDVKFRDPKDVTDVRLGGRVAAVRDGIAYLVYAGHIEGLHNGGPGTWEGQELFTKMKMISGVGAYDIRAEEMLSLTWVWDGLASDYYRPPYRGQPFRFGTVVEWRRGSPRTKPRGSEETSAEAIGRLAR